jgi:hypothetical protein
MNYSLTFTNNSANAGCVCIFQQFPEQYGNFYPLAWMANQSYLGHSCTFKWNTDLCFVWGKTGVVTPGSTFKASQLVSANVTTGNYIVFDNNKGQYAFSGLSAQGQPGALAIMQQSSVQPYDAAVGYGMSGYPAIIMSAMPNMTYCMMPNANFWIAFGNFPAGTILDPSKLKIATELPMPSGGGSLTVSLEHDNSWIISASRLPGK